MKNSIKRISSSIALAALFVNSAFAQSSSFVTGQDPSVIGAVGKGTLGGNITTIINYFLGILGLIAVAFLIYAGVLMVTAGGNEEQVGKARKIIMYGVAGIVIILLSWTIVSFVTSALG